MTDWSASSKAVRIAFAAEGAQQDRGPPTAEFERRYAMGIAKKRLHQADFRAAVLDAYGDRCAVTGLPATPLIEAAHIDADANVELGHAVVPNGLPLTRLHHAAYDAKLIGIDPDGRIHLHRDRIEMQVPAKVRHLLADGLLATEGARLRMPRDKDDRPDRDRLARRFEMFLKAE